MERYDRDLLDTAASLADLEPVSLGRMKRALRRHDDLLDEMLPPWT